MQSETVVRVRGADELEIRTLCPAEPWSMGRPGEDARNRLLNGWKLYLPVGADVTSRDRVEVRARTYSVLGEPEAWLGGGLVATVGDLWTAVCTIRRPGGTRGPFNTTIGTYPVTAADPHYDGECRVEVLPVGDQRLNAAEETVTEVKYLVIVDLDTSTEVHVDDLVTITADLENGDPILVGRSVQVQSFSRGAMPWQRNLLCSDLLPPEAIA